MWAMNPSHIPRGLPYTDTDNASLSNLESYHSYMLHLSPDRPRLGTVAQLHCMYELAYLIGESPCRSIDGATLIHSSATALA